MRNLFRDRPHFQRPHLPLRHRRELPANLWVHCPRCNELLYVREYEKNLKVCQKCEYHARLTARERIEQLLDPDSFREEDAGLLAADPLGFESLGQTYPNKIIETCELTGLPEAMLCGRGAVEREPLRLGVCDFGFMGASMGSVVGEKLTRAIERCVDERLPLLAVCTSGGARMHEGIFSLMQMAKTSAALTRLSQVRVPFICLLADPTTGGVTASWAGLGDVLIAEPGALVGFAGPRVIEQITKQKLPPDAQRAEFLLQHGMLDLVVPRRELRSTLARLLRLYRQGPVCGADSVVGGARGRGSEVDASLPSDREQERSDGAATEATTAPIPAPRLPTSGDGAWQRVQLARHPQRPYTLDYLRLILDEFVELHGDRAFAEDAALVGGLAVLAGRTVMVVGQQKGRDTRENTLRRFGMARPEGYRKALRLMRLAEKFRFPLISFIDTPGADPTLPSEERGQAFAIAANLLEMARLQTVSVAVVIGEGGSGGAIAIGLADRTLMLENAIYSVAAPEAAASILWRDATLAPQAAETMKITAQNLLAFELIDAIVTEPPGGAQTDRGTAAALLKSALLQQLAELDFTYGHGDSLDVARLLDDRYRRYRAIGRFREAGGS